MDNISENQTNPEYKFYLQKFKEINIKKILEKYSKKYKNKKILIYGNGIFFDVLADNYNLKKYFNIIGVSDKRYEKDAGYLYKGFMTFKPSQIKELDFDAVFITTAFTHSILKFFKRFHLLKEHTDVFYINLEEPENVQEIVANKLTFLLKYLFQTKDIIKTIKYMFVCNSNEIQSKYNYEKVLERIHAYPENRKIRVVFICEENSKWGYQSVYNSLKNDSRFEILPILCLPILTKNRTSWTQEENIKFFNKLNIEAVDGYDYEKEDYIDLKSLNPDIVFYQQHWYSLVKMPPVEVSKYALTCVVSYGFTSVDSEIWGMDTPKQFCGTLWKMFAESDYHKKFYERATKLKYKDILTVTGYPKLDYYSQLIDNEFELMWKDADKSEKHRIIWAPHHSIEDFGFGMSNFKAQAIPFLEYAKSHPEYSFVLKPHPALKYKCSYDGFMSEDEYEKYLDEWNNLSNAVVYQCGNYFDIFKTSDVLVTDSSSFLAEYIVSGKPIVFFDSPKRTPFNKFGLKIKKGFYEAKNLNDLDKILEKVLINKKDDLKHLREAIVKEEVYLPEGGIGNKIVGIINNNIFNLNK